MDNIILLFGGKSCERDISIITACQLYENIDKSKYNIYPIYMSEGKMILTKNMSIDNFFDVSSRRRDIVHLGYKSLTYKNKLYLSRTIDISGAILCNHGGEGENGSLQGYLDILGIPYTSPSSCASAILMDKSISKVIFDELNIPNIKSITLKKNEYINYVNIEKTLKYPIIVKPCRLGSSIGVGVVSTLDSLKAAIDLAFYYDDKIILEQAMEDFKEYNIAIYRKEGQLILSEIEMPKLSNKILGFEDKYMQSGKMNGGYRELPAKINKKLKNQIETYAKTVYQYLDMKGVCRFDYIVKGDNVYLNEVNTIPGSMAFYLFEGKGLNYNELIDDMLKEAYIDKEKTSSLISYYKSSVLKSAKFTINKLRK